MLSVCIAHSARSRIQARGRLIELFPRCLDSLCAAVSETGIAAELVVADYPQNRDAGPPLAEWLPPACTIPAQIVEMTGEWDKGAALNAAAAAAGGDVLFFLDCDFLVVAEVLRRGTAYARNGKVWFPGYLAQDARTGKFDHVPGRMGCGNLFVGRALFDEWGGWPSATQHGVVDQPAGRYFAGRGLSAESINYRPPVDGFVHLWHPKYRGWKRRKDAAC